MPYLVVLDDLAVVPEGMDLIWIHLAQILPEPLGWGWAAELYFVGCSSAGDLPRLGYGIGGLLADHDVSSCV